MFEINFSFSISFLTVNIFCYIHLSFKARGKNISKQYLRKDIWTISEFSTKHADVNVIFYSDQKKVALNWFYFQQVLSLESIGSIIKLIYEELNKSLFYCAACHDIIKNRPFVKCYFFSSQLIDFLSNVFFKRKKRKICGIRSIIRWFSLKQFWNAIL